MAWKIALCDDEEVVCQQLTAYLERLCTECQETVRLSTFRSAEELLQSKADFDILLLDIQMGGMSGMKAARELRRRGSNVVILFITSMTQYAIEGYEVHAFSFLEKPLRYEIFADRMGDAIRRIPEQDIFAVLLDDLHAQAAAAVELGRVWEEQHRRETKDVAAMRKNLVATQAKLERQERSIKAMYEAFALGEVDKAEYLAAKAVAAQQRDSLAARIVELESSLENMGADGRLQNRFVSSFQKYAEVQEITSEIVSDILKEVVIYPDGRLEIVWNYQDEFNALMLDVMGCADDEMLELAI